MSTARPVPGLVDGAGGGRPKDNGAIDSARHPAGKTGTEGGRVAFLFLGETLLMPHLYPIAEALAALRPDIAIDLWVSTSLHEELLSRWLPPAANIRIRRAPGYVALSAIAAGDHPPLPHKLLTLARLAPQLVKAEVVVCAERTSLWLPTLLPLRTRFILTEHGSGALRNLKSNRRRRAVWRNLVPGELDRETFIASGMPAEKVVVTGYIKASFAGDGRVTPAFPVDRPIVLYAPHWRNNSSWGPWGQQILDALATQTRFNIIFAPHQRLSERAPELRDAARAFARHDHVHVDLDSFAMVDGSYLAAADIYLGDNSSQVVEFVARPRPCVFLNPHALAWEASEDQYFWHCGDVVDRMEDVLGVLMQAQGRAPHYREVQERLAQRLLGDVSGRAPVRAAEEIIAALR